MIKATKKEKDYATTMALEMVDSFPHPKDIEIPEFIRKGAEEEAYKIGYADAVLRILTGVREIGNKYI